MYIKKNIYMVKSTIVFRVSLFHENDSQSPIHISKGKICYQVKNITKYNRKMKSLPNIRGKNILNGK